jgi:O-methyltransferase
MDYKTIVLMMFHRLGYEVIRIGKMGSKRGKYTLCYPYTHYTYSPWFEDWFQEKYAKVKDYTLLKENQCYVVYEFCLHCLHLQGDFAECGVYKGGSAFLIAETLASNSVHDKETHLFDTFTGMPAMANHDPSGLKEGRFSDTSLSAVKAYLRNFPFVVFHPGLIPNTLENVKDKRFAFVHIDVDLYQTTKDCLNFFYNRMSRGGIMIFDDYGWPFFKESEKKAADEFFEGKPETPIALQTGQAIMVKI